MKNQHSTTVTETITLNAHSTPDNNLSASQTDRTRKPRRPLRREIDAPLQDIAARIFEPENVVLHKQRDVLLLKSYGELRDVCFDVHPSMHWQDAERVLNRLAKRIHQFMNVPVEEDAFLHWASCYVSIQAHRQKQFDAIITEENLLSIRKGIWSMLKNCIDLGFDHNPDKQAGTIYDLQSEVILWIAQNLWKLAQPGERGAKLSTRLYAQGRTKARTWKTERLREVSKRRNFEDFVGYIEQHEKVPTDHKAVAA